MNNDVLVSVCTLTFNHAPYLNKYFEGILMQRTTFKYEVIINDDCSTDGTKEILLEYASKYPELIKVVIQDENQYSQGDRGYFAKYCYPRCKGKYVAWCEGDDCWTDPLKLQKQVDYLDTHPECVLVHTDFDVVNATTGERRYSNWRAQKNYNQINRDFGAQLPALILQGKYTVQTLTACARMKMVREIYANNKYMSDSRLFMGDTPIWMALATRGSVHILKESTADYHVILESVTHSKNYNNIIRFYSSCIDMINIFSKHLCIEEAGIKAKQKYINFLLRDIYLGDKSYLKEIEEKVIRSMALNCSNSLLVNTINAPTIFKQLIMLTVKIVDKIGHRIGFYKTKYIGV